MVENGYTSAQIESGKTLCNKQFMAFTFIVCSSLWYRILINVFSELFDYDEGMNINTKTKYSF